ncbi:hypothetical protein ACFPT7_20280 [Acidicapsa dinghuensis]|uniref:IS1 family transposase n=1 Tax=Acidicapsa dinghuensis TaxID=2218256 RepID=A0ABW1EMZ6_9BACT|nr:hypothetical protein [Acidicapsa dinghuensis]
MKSEKNDPIIGTAYGFVGMERNTKLVLCHHLGKRDANSTDKFMHKLSIATSKQKFQLTVDGFPPYPTAVKIFLPGQVHFATLTKVYGAASDGEGRYSPAEVVDSVPYIVSGNPVRSRICTSHIERVNLSIRMGMRRMTRLTNAFSKRWSHLEAAYSLFFAYYNFCRVHKTFRVTPPMESGLTGHVWTIGELLCLVG